MLWHYDIRIDCQCKSKAHAEVLQNLTVCGPCLQVVWLDCTAAKARYGRWIDGVRPSIIPFPKSGKPRKRSQQAPQTSKRRRPESEEDLPEGAEDHMLRLEGFKYATYHHAIWKYY